MLHSINLFTNRHLLLTFLSLPPLPSRSSYCKYLSRTLKKLQVSKYLSQEHILEIVPPAVGFLFHRDPVISPNQNVHVYVINHVASSLYSHPHEFHSNWRDFTMWFSLFYGFTAFWFHRRVLRRLADPSLPTSQRTIHVI